MHPFSHQLELFGLIKDMRKKENSCEDENDNVDCLWFDEFGDDYNRARDDSNNLIFPNYMSQYFDSLKTRVR